MTIGKRSRSGDRVIITSDYDLMTAIDLLREGKPPKTALEKDACRTVAAMLDQHIAKRANRRIEHEMKMKSAKQGLSKEETFKLVLEAREAWYKERGKVNAANLASPKKKKDK